MGSKTNYLEDAVLNFFLRNNAGSVTAPANVYVALFTAPPGETGGGTEVTGGSYARTVVTFSAPSPSGTTTNSADVTFPTATAGWGTVTDFAVFDASTSGNMLYYGTLTSSRVVLTGDVVKFVAGQLTITED